MKTRQRRTRRGVGPLRCLRLLVQVLLPLCCVAAVFPQPALGYLSYPAVFVGNTVADLKWSVGSCHEYWVMRDGEVIGTVPWGEDPWFRDEGLTSGETYSYLVSYRAADGSELRNAGPAEVTTGGVEGRLYRSLSLASGTHILTGAVYVHAGAALNVAPGTTVRKAEGIYSAGIESAGNAEGQYEHPGGPIRLTGVVVEDISVTFSSAEENVCSGNIFNRAAVNVLSPGALTIDQHNTFQDSSIVLTAAQTVIVGNDFLGFSFLRIVGDSGETTVEGNCFLTGARQGYEAAISVREGYAAITRNLWRVGTTPGPLERGSS